MKRITTILILCVFLTACVGYNEIVEPHAEITELSLAGRWELADSTEFVYSDWLTMYITIFADNTFFWQAYGNVRGDLVQTSDYEFIVTNIVAQSEGEMWLPDRDDRLTYDPQTGILRYSRFNEFTEEYMHYHFIRGVLPRNDDEFNESFVIPDNFSGIELVRTGEFFTFEEMNEKLAMLVTYQEITAGIGRFAHVIAIDFEDDREQQVFLSVNYPFSWEAEPNFDNVIYERIRVQVSQGAEARILYAGPGAGSMELTLIYEITTLDSEWIAYFNIFTGPHIEYGWLVWRVDFQPFNIWDTDWVQFN